MCCYGALSASLSPVESTVDPTAKSARVLITVVVMVSRSPSSVTAGNRLELPASEYERILTPSSQTHQKQRKVFGFHLVHADVMLPPSHFVVLKPDFHVSEFLT